MQVHHVHVRLGGLPAQIHLVPLIDRARARHPIIGIWFPFFLKKWQVPKTNNSEIPAHQLLQWEPVEAEPSGVKFDWYFLFIGSHMPRNGHPKQMTANIDCAFTVGIMRWNCSPLARWSGSTRELQGINGQTNTRLHFAAAIRKVK